MYSKTKTIVCLLITLCISVGGLVFTTVEAYADYTVNGNYYGTIYPRPIQFEFVDQNGNDFSENLTLSVPVTILKRNEKIDTVNDSIMATYPGPSTVSKIGGTNKFVYGNSLSNYFLGCMQMCIYTLLLGLGLRMKNGKHYCMDQQVSKLLHPFLM